MQLLRVKISFLLKSARIPPSEKKGRLDYSLTVHPDKGVGSSRKNEWLGLVLKKVCFLARNVLNK